MRPVRILQLGPEALQALSIGDLETAQSHAPVSLNPWLVSDGAIATWRFRARQAVETPHDLPWVTGLLCSDELDLVVGQAGFHAAPDQAGMVEVGYGVDPAHRRRGFARAALELLIGRARREPEVRTLRATISPDNAPSLALLAPYGFHRNGEQWDTDDGLELIFELDVSAAP